METPTKYKCDICGSEYDTFDHAQKCENQGTPPIYDTLSVGDSIQFFKEEHFGALWKYNTTIGTIKTIRIVKDNDGVHIPFVIAVEQTGKVRGLLLDEKQTWFSPTQYDFGVIDQRPDLKIKKRIKQATAKTITLSVGIVIALGIVLLYVFL